MYDDNSCLVRFVMQTQLSLVIKVISRNILLFLVQERGTSLQVKLCVTFTKENLCRSFRQRAGGQRSPLTSAVSQLPSAKKIILMQSGIFGGWCILIPFTPMLLVASFNYCEWNSWRAHELSEKTLCYLFWQLAY